MSWRWIPLLACLLQAFAIGGAWAADAGNAAIPLCFKRSLQNNLVNIVKRIRLGKSEFLVGDLGVTDEQVLGVHQVIEGVNRVLPAEVQPPPTTVVMVNRLSQDLQGGIRAMRVQTQAKLYMEDAYSMWRKQLPLTIHGDADTVFYGASAHEYGHVVFYESLLRDIPGMKKMLSALRDTRYLIELNRFNNLSKKQVVFGELPTDEQRSFRYRQEIRSEDRSVGDSDETELREFHTWFEPLNELMADLIQEVAARNGIGGSVAQVMPEFDARLRSFEQSGKVSEWNPQAPTRAPHFLTGPARGAIGRNLLENPWGKQNPSEVIRIVYQSVLEVIRARLENPHLDDGLARLEFVDAFKIRNQRLIDALARRIPGQ